MKRYLILFVVFLCLAFLAGAVDGFSQTLLFHFDFFSARFPSADPYWWHPHLSWMNKNCTGCGFWDRTFLVLFTDAYHLTRFLFWILLSGSAWGMGYLAPELSRKNWWIGLFIISFFSVAKMVGFTLVYTLYFSNATN